MQHLRAGASPRGVVPAGTHRTGNEEKLVKGLVILTLLESIWLLNSRPFHSCVVRDGISESGLGSRINLGSTPGTRVSGRGALRSGRNEVTLAGDAA